jgi:Malate synthase G, alpha-beta insertion domain
MPLPQQQDSLDAVTLLDDLIPLRNAIHSDVAEYFVEVPFRFAECRALLRDGRKVGLQEPRKFVGWSSHKPSRTLLFRVNGTHLGLDVADELAGQSPGKIHSISLETMALRCADSMRKFIGIDGKLMLLPTT